MRALSKLSRQRPFVLAIESSCDDSCIALLDYNKNVIYERIISQRKIHQSFGGVVPQFAASCHKTAFQNLLRDHSLRTALSGNLVNLIAVTAGPGLIQCLNAGHEFAKYISGSFGIPMLPVNHLQGHIFSISKSYEVKYPHLSLIISGGNTQIVLSSDANNHHVLGQTIDDAIGEAIDKTARLLNCNWSETGGLGKSLEELGKTGEIITTFAVRPLDHTSDPLSFSFSGIKTALKQFIESSRTKYSINDMAATVQHVLFAHLIDRMRNCIEILNNAEIVLTQISIIGGCSRNEALRKMLSLISNESQVEFLFPEPHLCTDNATMIGLAALEIVKNDGEWKTKKALRVNPEWHLEELSIIKCSLE